MKVFSTRLKKSGAEIFKKTLKAYSDREKVISLILVVVFLFSGWKMLSGNWEGQNLTNIVRGGHNYNEGLVGEIMRLNPVYADLNEVDRDITTLIFEGLSKYDPEQEKVVENIAMHTLDESKTLYTFTLREDLMWHDGEPLTAEDVYFTYHDVIQSPEFENPILKASFNGVEIQKVDERTVTMKLSQPNSFFFTHVTVGLLPKHLLAEVPVAELDSHEFNQMPIGNGPYKVKEGYKKIEDGSSRVELTFNEYYRKEFEPDITEINFIAYPTYEELIDARGQIHGMARVPKFRLDESQEDRLVAYEYVLPQYTALFINTEKEYLGTQKVRLAIQKAINKTKIIEAIGYDHTIDTPLLQLDQEDWIYQPDDENAAGALFDSGWKLDEQTGLRMRVDEETEEKEILSLTLVRRSGIANNRQEEANKTTSEMIKAELESVGIQVTIETYENETFQEKVTNREYDLLLYGQSMGYNLDTYSYWHSSQANGKGLNLSNYTNAKADFYIEAMRNTFGESPEKQKEHLQNLAEIIKTDIPAVFLYTPTYYFLADSRLVNVNTRHLLFPHDRFANILDWTVE